MLAVDATLRPRDDGAPPDVFIRRLNRELGVPVLADVDTLEAGVRARAAGAAAVATTLSGYTGPGAPPEGPDIELVAALAARLDCPVVAEGRYATPEQVRARLPPARSRSSSAPPSPTPSPSPNASQRGRRAHERATRRGALPERLVGPRPKGEQLRQLLEELIAELGAGAMLPSERMLAERYGVARMTVRKVLDRLVAERAAYRIQGRGTFVAEPRIVYADALKGFSEDILARGMVPGARVLAQEVVTADAALAAALERPPGTPVVLDPPRAHRRRRADRARVGAPAERGLPRPRARPPRRRVAVRAAARALRREPRHRQPARERGRPLGRGRASCSRPTRGSPPSCSGARHGDPAGA